MLLEINFAPILDIVSKMAGIYCSYIIDENITCLKLPSAVVIYIDKKYHLFKDIKLPSAVVIYRWGGRAALLHHSPRIQSAKQPPDQDENTNTNDIKDNMKVQIREYAPNL